MWEWDAWQGIGTAISAAAACAALLLAFRSNRKATEATANASRATLILERIAQAMESQAIAQSRSAPQVAWRLEWLQDSRYLLLNEGTATARDVHIAANQIPLRDEHAGDLAPSGTHSFLAIRTMQAKDTTITVTWSDDNGSAHTWNRPLPPKR